MLKGIRVEVGGSKERECYGDSDGLDVHKVQDVWRFGCGYALLSVTSTMSSLVSVSHESMMNVLFSVTLALVDVVGDSYPRADDII